VRFDFHPGSPRNRDSGARLLNLSQNATSRNTLDEDRDNILVEYLLTFIVLQYIALEFQLRSNLVIIIFLPFWDVNNLELKLKVALGI
jgi:hypothetical protein